MQPSKNAVLAVLHCPPLGRAGLELLPLLVMAGLFVVTFAVFLARVAARGLPRTERVERQGATVLVGRLAMEYAYWFIQPVVQACARVRIHPDALTWTSLVVQGAACVLIARGHFGLGGAVLLLGAAFDTLDGAVARLRGLASEAGEILDAAIDRVAEIAVLFAYAWYFRDYAPGFWAAAAACVGSVMVSYSRAKGQAVQVDAKMGLMQRHERAVYLAFGTVISPWVVLASEPGVRPAHHYLVVGILWLVAVLANLTGIQRTAYTRAQLRAQGR